MSMSRLMSLPRELRDIVIQCAIESPQPDPEFTWLVQASGNFTITSGSACPANLLSACHQLRAETFSHMGDRKKVPKVEIHILRTHGEHWKIGMAWVVPPSACAQYWEWKVGYMDIDIKPRTTGVYVQKIRTIGVPQAHASSRLWHDDLFRRLEAGNVLGHLVTRAIQRLGVNQIHSKISEEAARSRTHPNSNIILRRLRINVDQADRYPGIPLPDIVERNLRKDILEAMVRYVSSGIACCSADVKTVAQRNGFKKVMCYCHHRRMWYTQVGDMVITNGPMVCHRINIAHMLNNDIYGISSDSYKRDLEQMMALRKRNNLDHVKEAGSWRRYRIELPCSMHSTKISDE
jgi:hypothetical protein